MNTVAIEKMFEETIGKKQATSSHLRTIRSLASECLITVEFGVLSGNSAIALILGTKELVYGYDIKQDHRAKELEVLAGGKFRYIIQNVLSDDCDVPKCDMIFFDSLHTYKQLQGELIKHGNKARKYLLFHDTISFATRGEVSSQEFKKFKRTEFNPDIHGIRLAIDEYMMLRPQWKIKFHHPHGYGLLCLENEWNKD